MSRHDRIGIADGHSDLLQELVFAEERGEANPFRSRWLEQLQEGGVALQICAVYESPQSDPGDALRDVFRQIASFHTAVESNPEVFAVGSRQRPRKGQEQRSRSGAGDRRRVLVR